MSEVEIRYCIRISPEGEIKKTVLSCSYKMLVIEDE